jgi:hypothetical protein
VRAVQQGLSAFSMRVTCLRVDTAPSRHQHAIFFPYFLVGAFSFFSYLRHQSLVVRVSKTLKHRHAFLAPSLRSLKWSSLYYVLYCSCYFLSMIYRHAWY